MTEVERLTTLYDRISLISGQAVDVRIWQRIGEDKRFSIIGSCNENAIAIE